MVSDRGLREGFQAPIEPAVPIAPDRAPPGGAAEESRSIKAVARRFGADLAGIAEIDLRRHYATRVDTRDFSMASGRHRLKPAADRGGQDRLAGGMPETGFGHEER